jgi:hypothetical protein
MNERLEHLMWSSGLTASGCWDEMDDYAREAIEKFAELIVRECAEVAMRECYDPAEGIKHHFGLPNDYRHFGVQE